MARPIASVIISAKNEAPRLGACLASLSAQKGGIPFEIHLVDNASNDGTYALARRLAKSQKNLFVWREKKPGSPAARNLGARKARGDILLFTDADCILDPNWVAEMSRPLLSPMHYPLAAVGGATTGVFQKQNPNFWETYVESLFDFWESDRLGASPAFLPWASTRNFAVRKEVFQALGGFDENWRAAAYDVDFCWRLVLCGFVIGQAPRAKLHHQRRHSLRGILRQMENYAYYNHSLLSTYHRELKLPLLETQKERLLSRGRRALELIRSTNNFTQAKFRGIDGLVSLAVLKGTMEARIKGAKANPKLSATRRGLTPKSLEASLSRGYSHLHRLGWAYWKAPADVAVAGEFVLFKPRAGERFILDPNAWAIWETKAEKGQSEDAAEAIGQSASDEKVLQDIDELTMDLHSRRLLP
jgi:glycosyltransferase involved in cell wall biosynthesis